MVEEIKIEVVRDLKRIKKWEIKSSVVGDPIIRPVHANAAESREKNPKFEQTCHHKFSLQKTISN